VNCCSNVTQRSRGFQIREHLGFSRRTRSKTQPRLTTAIQQWVTTTTKRWCSNRRQRSIGTARLFVHQESASTSTVFFNEIVRPLLIAHSPDLLWIDPALAFIGGDTSSQNDVGGLLKSADGVHLVGSGFDPVTGFYVLQSKVLPKLSVKEAVQRIKFIIEDYDFVTPGDRSRAIASIITPAMRFGGFISGHIR
jgi:hypothetical protein